FSAPTAPVAASPPAFCVGDPISDLTATGTGVIKWYSDILLNDSIGTGSPFTSGATSDTAYWVAGTSNGCVGASTQVDIVINSTPPAPFAGNDTAICFGAVVNVTLNVTGGSGTEWWLDAGLTIPLDTGNLLTIPPSIGVNIYYVTQSNGSCRGPYDSVIVTMDAPVTASIAGNDTICEGNPTTLTASGGTTYLWSTTETSAAISVSPTVTTTYNVIVGDGACSATVSHTVNIESLPVANITITGGSANLCGGESLTLSSDPADTYSWDTSPGSTTQVITFTPPAGINSVYTLTVTNSCGSDNTSLPVTVEALLDAGPDLDLCKNTDIVGFAATGSATPPGGTWSSPDPVIFPGNLQPNGFIDHIAIPWGSGYELVYTSASGQCADTLLLEVTGAEAGADTTVCTGASSFFLSNPSPAGGTWSSPDINAANNLDGTTGEVLLEGLAGPYVFVYETLGLTGKSCPDSVVVKICGSNDVWIPNIFSPNGDSENDIMFVRGIALDWVQILIYDRWGEQVYDSGKGTMALDEGWDGTYKGKELTPQVFVYYLNGAYLDGEVIEMKKGNITLVK
ncbi:MAG: gliding motility-associated C-terminal domain-containing protein, partial [Flavobacteriales bacterium]|nr:gliding motility-associated C-terminal domain-containing protein [Flavobacteriales bacterium]